MALTIPGESGRSGVTIVFDGAGRYAWERVLPLGLRERVVLRHLEADRAVVDRNHMHAVVAARQVGADGLDDEDSARDQAGRHALEAADLLAEPIHG